MSRTQILIPKLHTRTSFVCVSFLCMGVRGRGGGGGDLSVCVCLCVWPRHMKSAAQNRRIVQLTSLRQQKRGAMSSTTSS